jgi:hypothetical protein
MCVIVDTCVFHNVFKGTDGEFVPIRKWLLYGKGKMVFGGSTYEKQLKQMPKYARIIAELSRAGKIVVVDRRAVDKKEKQVRLIEPNPDFDDPHLVAIVDESRCRVVCTLDARADRYLRQTRFYSNCRRPKIYRQHSHEHLLCDANIVGACIRR